VQARCLDLPLLFGQGAQRAGAKVTLKNKHMRVTHAHYCKVNRKESVHIYALSLNISKLSCKHPWNFKFHNCSWCW